MGNGEAGMESRPHSSHVTKSFCYMTKKGKMPLNVLKMSLRRRAVLSDDLTCCLGQVKVSLLLILNPAHNLISCIKAFHNRPLVTFIFKIHLRSADQKLSRVE